MLTYVCVCVYRDELCFLYISLVYIYIFIINYSSYNLMTCCCFCSLSTFFKCVSLCILYDYYENTYMYVCVSRYKSCFYNSSTGACKIAGVYVMLFMYIMFPRSSFFNSPSLSSSIYIKIVSGFTKSVQKSTRFRIRLLPKVRQTIQCIFSWPD